MLLKAYQEAATTTRSNRRIGVFDPDDCYVSFNAECFRWICERIEAERLAWRRALGVPRAFDIPKKPIPADRGELEAELAIVTQRQLEAYEAMQALPPGQERESQAFAMVAYRERRWLLISAIRDDDTAEP